MKISEQWLREWVDPAINSEELAAQLTMAGLEVDSIEAAAAEFSGVVVGRVQALTPHPEADKLNIASVDVGQAEALQIVCGAANISVGMHAPTALIGAKLAGGVKIRKTKLRGVTSHGMLCSGKELGLSEEASGLLALPEDSPIGINLRDLLALNDRVIEVDLTPNRSDCLGMVGIAREVGVLNRKDLTPMIIDPVAASNDATFAVTLSDPADCPRYVGRVIRNVDAKAPSPLWLVERLRRAGVRSLGPLVDITNYVMLELGQPMHAFDLNKLTGHIDVRRARAGESLTLLNQQSIELEADVLLITDASGPIALAGIMGGATTEIDDHTCDLFLESAFFTPTSISGRARRYGLHTDASHRYERGVDPALQGRAVERASALLLAICGGEPGPLIDTLDEQYLPQRCPIHLRQARIALLLGLALDAREVEDILRRLGMLVESNDSGWTVTPPSFRFDISLEADLIEELGRIYGYDRLPTRQPAMRLAPLPCPETGFGVRRLRDTLVDRGFQEVISYSFVDAELQTLLDPQATPIRLTNPISSEMAVMRTTLWAGLVKTLLHNQQRQQTRARLFEIGCNFRGSLDALSQEPYLAGLIRGDSLAEQWGSPRRSADFFDLKGDVEALLAPAMGGQNPAFVFTAATHPALHPGQSCRIEREDTLVGWLGALHPRIAHQLDLDGTILLFELKIDTLGQVRKPTSNELSKFPHSRRDLAFIVDEAISAQQMVAAIHRYGGERLRAATLFDLYRGKGVPENHKSMAFGLILQDFSSNLTDEDVTQIIESIKAGLEREFGATLRV